MSDDLAKLKLIKASQRGTETWNPKTKAEPERASHWESKNEREKIKIYFELSTLAIFKFYHVSIKQSIKSIIEMYLKANKLMVSIRAEWMSSRLIGEW